MGIEVRMTEIAPERSLPLPAPGVAARARSWRYAPRPDSEAALARLTALLRAGETRVTLVGPPASGKTLLLHVLSERLGPGFASAYLPNPAIAPQQVRRWLETCGETVPADAGATLADLAHAHALRGPGLVLLVDDADDMSEAVATAFGATLAHSDGELRMVLAGADEERLAAVLAQLGGGGERVTIGELRPQPAPAEPAPQRPAPAKPATPAPAAPPAPAAAPARSWRPLATAAAGVLLAAAVALALARYTDSDRTDAPVLATATAQPAAGPPPVAAAPPAPPVLVHLNARPWARVSVDGRALGLTPLGNVPIEPGVRRFRAEMADGRVIEREVTIDDASRRVTFP